MTDNISNNIDSSIDDQQEDKGLFNLITLPEMEEIETVVGSNIEQFGSMVLENNKSAQDLMIVFIQWWMLVNSLVQTANNTIQTQVEMTYDTASSANNLIATVKRASSKDNLGHVKKQGVLCPECQKQLSGTGVGGFCSEKCAMSYAKKQAEPAKVQAKKAYQDIIDIYHQVNGILSHTTLLLNAIATIPNIISELSVLEEPYKSYIQAKINEGYCLLYSCIQKMLIKKAKIIKNLLKKIKFGNIPKPISIIFTSILVLLNSIELAETAFDAAYSAVVKAVEKLANGPGGLAIDGESLAWVATPRSYISPKPVTNPDSGKMFVNLPGGSGTKGLALAKPLMPSAIQNIDMESIEKFIRTNFPPLAPIDYYLDPELFNVRYLFSDQSNIALQIRQQLEDIMTYGLDYIPKFENMLPIKTHTYNINGQDVKIPLPNIAYAWFLLGLADSWAPHSVSLVGSLLNPLA